MLYKIKEIGSVRENLIFRQKTCKRKEEAKV
jgi:hypothetical protein